jgi:hypothetical protein
MVTPVVPASAPLPRVAASAETPAPVIVETAPVVDQPVLEPPVRPARPAQKMIAPPAPATPIAPPAPAAPAAPAPIRPAPTGPAPDPTEAVLEIEDGETTLFEAAIGAFHAGEFQRAESLFLEEAERCLDTAPQRAAIAFRQAALAARQGGNIDGSDHWMRLAGREYLKVSEDDRTPLPYIREAALMAAKCFLSVENLQVAGKGLRRAQAIDSVLRADDDLLAPAPGIPFRHEDSGSTPVVDWTTSTAPADPIGPSTPIARTTGAEASRDGDERDRRGSAPRGWRRRLGLRRPSHGVV